MKSEVVCRLCLESCNNGYCDLYNQDVQKDFLTSTNEIFDMVKNYFSDEFLNMDYNRHLRKLCIQCWQYIDEFHKFQESIILLHTMKMPEVIETVVVDENKSYPEPEVPIKMEEFTSCEPDTLEKGTEIRDNVEANVNGCIIKHENETQNFTTPEIKSEFPEENISEMLRNTEDLHSGSVNENPMTENKQKRKTLKVRTFLPETPEIESGSFESPDGNSLSYLLFNPEGLRTAYDYDISSDEEIRKEHENSLVEMSGYNAYARDNISKTPLDFNESERDIKQELETEDYTSNEEFDDKSDEDFNISNVSKDLSDTESSIGESLKDRPKKQSKIGQGKSNQFPATHKSDLPITLTSDEENCRGLENPTSPKSKKRTKFSYRKHLKRPETREEYDDLIAQWKPSLVCRVCSATCSRYTQLEQHFTEHHANEECYIECCQLQLRYRYELEEHIYYHRVDAFKCEICFKFYTSKGQLQVHLFQRHGLGEECKPRESAKCPDCGKEYASQYRLRIHQNYCEGEEGRETRRYTCPDCGAAYKSKYVMKSHRNHHHQARGLSRCPICDKMLTTKSEVTRHLRTHSSERKYVCQVCQDAFTNPDMLRSHFRRIHVEEYKEHQKKKKELRNVKKTYKCDQCDKVYQSPMALKEHKAQHEGIRALYKCKYCTKEYKYSSNMAAHVQRVHPTKYAGNVKKSKK